MKPYGKGETAHDIFAAADKSMYTHKESRKKRWPAPNKLYPEYCRRFLTPTPSPRRQIWP